MKQMFIYAYNSYSYFMYYIEFKITCLNETHDQHSNLNLKNIRKIHAQKYMHPYSYSLSPIHVNIYQLIDLIFTISPDACLSIDSSAHMKFTYLNMCKTYLSMQMFRNGKR